MKIKVKGVVIPNDYKEIYEWLGWEHIAPVDVESALAEAAGEDVEVEINSVGGDVFSGVDIYTMLKEYAGGVMVKIVGLAASAASLIAMAGTKVSISPPAQIMVHNVSSIAWGDYRVMEHEAAVLKGWNKSIANAYMLKSGMSQSELLGLMNKESWLTAQESLKYGLVDEIMFDEGLQLAAASSMGGTLLPRDTVNKLKNLLKKRGLQDEGTNPLNVLVPVDTLPPATPPQAMAEEVAAAEPENTDPLAPRQDSPVEINNIYDAQIKINKEVLECLKL